MQAGITLNGNLAGVEVSNGLRYPRHILMTELSFAYDAAIILTSREDLVMATVELNKIVTTCGLKPSVYQRPSFWLQ